MKKPATTFYRPHGYQPEDSVSYLMRQILSLIARSVGDKLAHTDLTNAQWIPLFKLYTQQASTVAELARASDLDNGATTRLLDRLEAKGLCQRVRSESDRRVVNIHLTDAGTAAAEKIPGVLCDVQNAQLTGFTADEFETLKSYLRRMLSNAQAQTLTNNPTDSGTLDVQ